MKKAGATIYKIQGAANSEHSIAEEEKVEVSNEDLAQAATREAMMRRVDPQAYVKELSQDRARISRLREDILYDKTLELVASKGKEKVVESDEKKTD